MTQTICDQCKEVIISKENLIHLENMPDNYDYIDTFKAIATMCERGKRESALLLFNALVATIREESATPIHDPIV